MREAGEGEHTKFTADRRNKTAHKRQLYQTQANKKDRINVVLACLGCLLEKDGRNKSQDEKQAKGREGIRRLSFCVTGTAFPARVWQTKQKSGVLLHWRYETVVSFPRGIFDSPNKFRRREKRDGVIA